MANDTQGIKEVLELKHKHAMELMQAKTKFVDHTHAKKEKFTTFLYDKKNQFLEKSHKLTLQRIDFAWKKRRK